ncbi:MAG TPA: prepilin-type N-terminal cleavage/methylation domain-containing protein [Pyrinomonadaceae bacterium]|jgi:Tfp pilus assembly protein PilV|nr:prepilin-type N-terminal cleavage/methylation domain-containing protein [Pyrinomonadaceae bacterium]
MRRNVARERGERGFSLVETAIAMIVLMVAGLAATSLFVYSVKYNSGATDRAVAQALAQRQMESLRKTSFAGIAASTTTVASAGRNYTVDVAVCNDGTAACGGSAAVKRLTVMVTPANAGNAWARRPVTLVTLRSSTDTGTFR